MTLKSIFPLIFFLLCCKLFFAQSPFPYGKSWKKIDSLINQKGLPKSALEEVNRLYAAAKKEKQEAQWVKALLYKHQLGENGSGETAPSLVRMDQEIATVPPRVAAVWKSIEAETLFGYLQQQRYELSQRTGLENDTSGDISTWTAGRLNRKITALYLASLKDEQLLQHTDLKAFDPVLREGNTRNLRPTLYDLLLYRALDYFQRDDPEQPMAEDAYLMDDSAVFASAKTFSDYRFPEDHAFGHLTALKLFQALLKFHAQDTQPDAAVDADIHRLSFVNRYAVMPGKEDLYVSALQRITDQFPDLPAAAQAWYLQAAVFAQKAASFDPLGDSSHRYDYIKAKAICDQVVVEKDSSEGKSNCIALLNNIVRKSFRLRTEMVNLPGQPFRALVSYKNTGHLYARIIQVDDATRKALGDNVEVPAMWKKLRHFPVLRSFDQALPLPPDYQEHRVEIRIDPLAAGQYALFTSSDPGFADNSILCVQYIFSSSIAYVEHGFDYFVVDRDTGNPLAAVTVKSMYAGYSGRDQGMVLSKIGQYKTDEHGHFRLNPNRNGQVVNRLEFYHGKDYLSTDCDNEYAYSNQETLEHLDAQTYEKRSRKDILFTDRSIYRPGQTVYFKGLLVTRDFISRRYKIVQNAKAKIFLFDANRQAVDSLILSPDEFGSVHGSFLLPLHLLNGEFTIRDKETNTRCLFSVEEYKRPKFFVSYDTLRGSYHVGDSIRISGSAKGYAGNVISGSRVSYRVVRESRFPYVWYLRKMPANTEQEIRHGETITDAHGSFSIHFSALPDREVKKESKPVFTYRIQADVTDLNGETRSATTSVAASYQSFQIVSSLPQESRMSWDSLCRLTITTQNASGIFVSKPLSVSVDRLKAPDRLIRERYWEQPDQFILSKEEYLKAFPHDEYRDETDKNTWAKQSLVLEKTENTRDDGTFFPRPKEDHTPGWHASDTPPAGWYLFEFRAKDDDGTWITVKRFIEIVGDMEFRPSYPVYNLIPEEEFTGQPGDTREIRTGTSVSDAFVIRSREGLDDSLTTYSFYQLSDHINSTSVTLGEKDRGGFAVNDVFVKNNRWFSSTHLVNVPWTNKELQINFETWRSKLLPGSTETWKIKISGDRKNRVAAQILTAMYDASLDQFKPHAWDLPDLYPRFSQQHIWSGTGNFVAQVSMERPLPEDQQEVFTAQYEQLISSMPEVALRVRGMVMGLQFSPDVIYGSARPPGKIEMAKFTAPKIVKDGEPAAPVGRPESQPEIPTVQIRKDFNETAFFFPDLKTDDSGNVTLSFTMPEALTQWKWMVFAHTRDLAFGYSEQSVVTQKDLMLLPNMPRFLREGDTLRLPVKLSNLSGGAMTGSIKLDLLNAADNSNQNVSFQNNASRQSFSIAAGQNAVVYFPVIVPDNFQQPVIYRLQAETDTKHAGDGEEAMIPVLSNRMLVTESFPINMRDSERRHYAWTRLLDSKNSPTIKNQSLTLEYSSNPVWYAVQSLPYMMEFPHACAEQTFNRFYANALARQIVRSAPRIRAIFEEWKNADSTTLLSNLQKNEELKTALLRETPWVLEAQEESQQKKNLALLFDMVKMNRELMASLDKLRQMQSESGGFPWFTGGREDRYITQYIVSGVGRLKKLNAIPEEQKAGLDNMVNAALIFLDKALKSDYDHRPKNGKEDISATQIQYLYLRSFFPDKGLAGSVFPAMNYYRQQASRHWVTQNKYLQGMIVLFLSRTGDKKTAKDILHSLRENATVTTELGAYWKSVVPGYRWEESPVETQALLIEAFGEIGPDPKFIDAMKYWLLQQKHTRHWASTRATADACYALLLNGSTWLANDQTVEIKLGEQTVSSGEEKTAAGTGYFKKVFSAAEIRPGMGNINVTVSHPGHSATVPSWGGLYWQYFENLDQISAGHSSLSVSKGLYISRNRSGGPLLEAVEPGSRLMPGDQLVMRIIIKTDRDLEYVHLKDMRAACLEPKDVLSGYNWKGGLGYYESVQDESTSFFFDYLPAGTQVLEYPLMVTTGGTYSNGISTLECLYAPEFAAHTEGIRIHVNDNN